MLYIICNQRDKAYTEGLFNTKPGAATVPGEKTQGNPGVAGLKMQKGTGSDVSAKIKAGVPAGQAMTDSKTTDKVGSKSGLDTQQQ